MSALPIKEDNRFYPSKKVPLILFFVLCGILFFILNYQNAILIKYLFQKGQFRWMNAATGVLIPQKLEFYLGRMQEVFFGPLSQIIAGLGFAVYCFVFLRNASSRKFALAVFGYLLFTKFDVLLFPPYGDAIGGPFAEALFLKDVGFNYPWLAQQVGYEVGGPRVYLFSTYPTYLAVLMKLLPWPQVFLVVNHLLVFGMAATVATLLRSILRKVDNPVSAILGTLVLLAIPSFQVQTEAINMEMPSTFFIMLSAYFLIQKKFPLAGAMTILAVGIKGTEILACWAFFLISAGLFFGLLNFSKEDPAEKKWTFNTKVLLWGVAMLAVSCLKVLSKFLINDAHIVEGMLRLGIGWYSLSRMPSFYIYLVCVAIFAAFFLKWKKGEGKEGANILPHPPREFYTVWVMIVYAAMWFSLFFNFYAVSPRYRVSLYPFLVFVVIYAVSFLIRRKYWREWGIVLVLVITLFGSYGAFYKPMEENDHVQLERSLEYRNDLEVNRQIVKSIESRFADFQIVAPFIIAQSLAIPELGYIEKKMKVMIYGFSCIYRNIQPFPGMKRVRLGRTVYVGVKVQSPIQELPYPLNPYDRVVEEIQYGNKKAWLFFGGISIDSVLRASNRMKLKELAAGEPLKRRPK